MRDIDYRESLDGITLTVMESMQVGVFVLDPSFKVIWANSFIEEIFGLKVDQVIGRDKRELTERVIKYMFKEPETFGERLLATYRSNTYVEDFRCHIIAGKGRKDRWLRHWSCPISKGKLKGGRIEHYYDITAQVEAEHASFRESENLRNLFEHTGTAIALVEEDTTVSMVNSEFERLSGFRRSEIEGKMRWASFVVPEDVEWMKEFHRARREGDESVPSEYEFRFVNRSGQMRHILNRVGMIPGTRRVIASLLDITDRKLTETALREAEEKYRTLAEFAQACIVMIQEGETVYRNPYYEKLLGYSIDDTRGQNFAEIVAPEYRKLVRDNYEKRMRGEHVTIPYEVEVIAKDGNRVGLEVRSTLVHYKGKPAVMAVMSNITERKKAEKEKQRMQVQLRQAQKMEAIGTLAGGIAHDFNNILAAIVGYIELAMMDLPEGIPAFQSLSEALESALRARDLIKQILAFSRGSELECRPIEIRPVVKEGMKMLRASLPKTIEIKENISSDGLTVSNPTQVNQVLINICTNAAHAMKERGGILEVGLEDVRLDQKFQVHGKELPPGNYIRLRVRDTGGGIHPDHIDRIFDPYFTTKDVGEGTGLGLAVVHGIVDSCDGGIVVDSKVGKGTVFDVYFPRIAEEGSNDQAEEKTSIPIGTERVLFVDDEKNLLDIGKRILESLGYKVKVANDPVTAYEIFSSDPDGFDLVITDRIMPKMRGEKLASDIHVLRPDIPIILCTGYSDTPLDRKIESLGIQALAMKPLRIHELAVKIREVLDANKARGGGCQA